MLPIFLLLAAVDLVAAFAPGQRNILDRRQDATFTGVATFVNFGGQGNTVCGPKSGTLIASFELSPQASFLYTLVQAPLEPTAPRPATSLPTYQAAPATAPST